MTPRRAIHCLLLAALLATPAAARAADLAIVPSGDGYLGAWLVAGPIGVAAIKRIDPGTITLRAGEKTSRDAWAPRWRPLASGGGAIDLQRALGVGRQAGPIALVGGVLRVPKRFEGWLLVSVDGAAEVFVGAQRIWRRDADTARGGAWDAIPLALDAGAHRLVMSLAHPGLHWAFEVRVLDRGELRPPGGASLVLPGVGDREAGRMATSMTSVSVSTELSATGFHPLVTIEHLRGAPRGVERDVSIVAKKPGEKGPLVRAHAGRVPVGRRGVHRMTVQLPQIETQAVGRTRDPARVTFRVSIGDQTHERRVSWAPGAPKAFARARDLIRDVDRGAVRTLADADVARATLDHRLTDLISSGADGIDARTASSRLAALERLVDAIVDGTDPVHDDPGLVDLALRSAVDGRPQPVVVHIPADYDPKKKKRRYPMTVVLHGYGGTPRSVLQAFFDSRGNGPFVSGFVIAPAAHGDSFYRGPGERNVLDVIDWALETYPIEPRRVSITGVSMGGTGAAHLALRYPDRFSAASPLCGYHSFFVRRDTANRPIRPWETPRMHHFSPASWAENGRNLPMYVAHGTKDFPLENSKVLVERYRELGYDVADHWPETGHAVWEKTWSGGRMWPWLSKHLRAVVPLHVTLKTDSLRFASQAWVHLRDLERPEMARIDALIGGPDRIVVKTENARAFSLDRPHPRIKKRSSVSVEVDGQLFGFGPSEAIELAKTDDKWSIGRYERPAGAKRAGVEGPIGDAYLGDLVFVYGTLDPRQTRANREVAEAFAGYRARADVQYPVIRDRELEARTERTSSLFVVGNEKSNAVLSDLGPLLPIRVVGDQVQVGEKLLSGRDIGAIFVSPSPRSPGRYLVIVTSPNAAGIWRALSLPRLLPDFIVYDHRLAPSAGEVVLGQAVVRAGGFFNDDWTVPKQIGDIVAAPPIP